MTVVIIGAGIVGLSVAYELASRGAQVRVIDPRGLGQGATRASAGILAPYIEGHVAALLELGLCSLKLYPDFVARVEADSGQHVEFERDGTVQVAFTEQEAAQLSSSARALAGEGAEHALVDGEGARRLEPKLSERVKAALFVRTHGYVAPRPLAAAVAEAALRRGVTVSGAAVIGIEAAAGGVAIQTTEDVIRADAAVIAAGSWSSRLLSGEEWVKPIRGQLVQLRGAERAAARVVWSSGCYIVPWRDGTVLVGATVEDVGFDETATAGAVRRLLDAAMLLLPHLEQVRFQEVRVGLRPMIPDELPVIGRSAVRPGVFYATGHYRNGVLLAPLTAQLLADLVLDGRERDELALVRPARLGL